MLQEENIQKVIGYTKKQQNSMKVSSHVTIRLQYTYRSKNALLL